MLLSERVAVLGQLQQTVGNCVLPLQTVVTAETLQQGIEWQILRLDAVDEELSGNKLFKLLPYLEKAVAIGCDSLLSFGGRYSNHLHALAHACRRFGFRCVAFVRGYPEQELTPTLRDLYALGAQVHFLSRQDYRKRYEREFQQTLLASHPNALLIEEGGNGKLGMQGMGLLAQLLTKQLRPTDYLVLPSGTACCFLGLLEFLPIEIARQIVAVLAVKNASEVVQKIPQSAANRALVVDGFQMGGFAKCPSELLAFMESFKHKHAVDLDPVYTAKMCFAIDSLIKQHYFKANSRIVSLHTGGLQGARG